MKVGRPFLAEEAQAGESLIVVSEGFWQRTLGGNPSLSEQTVSVDGSDYRVVGVAPMGVTFPSQVDLWIPFQYRPMPGASRNNVNWLGIGRLAGGVTIQQAEADLSSIADGIREADPEALYSFGVGVESLREAVVGDTAGSLIMLQGAVLLVLLVGCANLMGLEFAGARERQQEIAVRLSLGVGRGRLLQQLVTEQLAFALVGGSVGILIGGWGTAYFTGRLGSLIPRGHEITFDARVAAVGFGLSLLAGLMSGLAPSWRASAGDPGRVLAESRVVRGGRGLPGSALVSAEVALTVLLLTGGGLLLRSMGSLVRRDLGFDPENVVTLDVTLQAPEYLADVDRVSGYWTTLLATLEQTSGVAAVGAGNWVPTGGGGSTFVELPEIGRTESGAGYRVVSDRYFEAMGTPLLRGRGFGVEDQDGSERVVIVNETMARTLWPGENPLGKRVRAAGMEDYFFGGQAPWLTVIGVVGDLRHHGFESDTRSEMFTLYRQVPWMARIITVIVRARPGLLASVMTTAQETARAVDPGLPVQVGRMDRRVRDLMVERRLTTSVLVGFGLVALGLASLGLYGLLSLAVSARTREMAIRSALGAHRADLVGMVVLSGLRVVALGLLIGALAAMGLLRVLDSLLVGVKFSDPITGAVVLATITLVSLAAVMAPAFRAARMDPAEALRNQ
jgi:predicted permease